MSRLYHYAMTHPDSVEACRFDVSNRCYDCKHCEHFHVDCDYADFIQQALNDKNYDLLPRSLQHKLLANKEQNWEENEQKRREEEHMEEEQYWQELEEEYGDESPVRTNLHLDPKRLP